MLSKEHYGKVIAHRSKSAAEEI